MRISQHHIAPILFVIGLTSACASGGTQAETSPVQAVTASRDVGGTPNDIGKGMSRRGDDGTMVAKVQAPAPLVWDAVKGAMEARNVKLTIFDRAAGRMGDTTITFNRRWAGQAGSFYFNCGENMTGQRADEDRIKAVLLAQLSRGTADSLLVTVHLSAFALPVSMGGSSTTAQCNSTGRGEAAFLEDVLRRLGAIRG